MKRDPHKDYVLFLKDISFEDETPLFLKGGRYEILDENKDYIYVSSKVGTNECSRFPKSEEGKVFFM